MSIPKNMSLKQVAKSLNNLRECFHPFTDEYYIKADEMADCVITTMFDTLTLDEIEEDNKDLLEAANSIIFNFSTEERQQFIKDMRIFTTEAASKKYMARGVANILDIMDKPLVDYSVVIKSNGSSHNGIILSYELTLKPNFTPRDFFIVCKKFMDHKAHSVSSIELDGKCISVDIDSST